MKKTVYALFATAFLLLNTVVVTANSSGVATADSYCFDNKLNLRIPIGRKPNPVRDLVHHRKSYIEFKKETKVKGDFYLGRPTKIIYIIITPVDIPNIKLIAEFKNAKFVSGDKIKYVNAKANVAQELSFTIQPTGSPLVVNMGASGMDKSNHYSWASSGIYLWLVDKKTGKLGTEAEKYKGVEYHYDACDGSFTKEFMPGAEIYNRKIIAMMKKLEPTLSDSEALCLYGDKYEASVPYGYKPKGAIDNLWDDSELFKLYLDNGWLKAFRGGNRESWNKGMRKKNEKSWEGKS